MKRSLFIYIIIIFIISIVGCDSQQTPTKEKSVKSIKEIYELQDKCGKQCMEWFIKRYGNPPVIKYEKGGFSFVSFENHYNKKMNKCFLLVISKYFKGSPGDKNEELISLMKDLTDFQENRQIGLYISDGTIPSRCFVSNKECKSEGEWNILVKPYMEE
jgi:hypothetical protein